MQLAAIKYYSNLEPEEYYAFKDAYFEHFEQLYKEKQYLLISLVNALAVFPNLDENNRQEYLFLYKFGFKNDLLTENGKISSFRFNNIMFIAESLGDYQFLEKVIEKLGPLIRNKREQSRSLLLANAYVCFYKRKYEEAISHLRILEKCRNLPHYLMLRKYVLDFKCAYENAEDKQEAFLYLKKKENSFRKRINIYLNNGEISELLKKFDLNFFNLLCKIADRKHSKEAVQKKLAMLKGIVSEQKWILEIIGELKK